MGDPIITWVTPFWTPTKNGPGTNYPTHVMVHTTHDPTHWLMTHSIDEDTTSPWQNVILAQACWDPCGTHCGTHQNPIHRKIRKVLLVCPSKLSLNYHITWRLEQWVFKTNTFGISWCEHFYRREFKGQQNRGNRTERLWEEICLWEGLWEGVFRVFWEAFRDFWEVFRGPLRDPLRGRSPLRGSQSCCP